MHGGHLAVSDTDAFNVGDALQTVTPGAAEGDTFAAETPVDPGDCRQNRPICGVACAFRSPCTLVRVLLIATVEGRYVRYHVQFGQPVLVPRSSPARA